MISLQILQQFYVDKQSITENETQRKCENHFEPLKDFQNTVSFVRKFDHPDQGIVTLLAAARLKNDQSFIRSIQDVHLGKKDF